MYCWLYCYKLKSTHQLIFPRLGSSVQLLRNPQQQICSSQRIALAGFSIAAIEEGNWVSDLKHAFNRDFHHFQPGIIQQGSWTCTSSSSGRVLADDLKPRVQETARSHPKRVWNANVSAVRITAWLEVLLMLILLGP